MNFLSRLDSAYCWLRVPSIYGGVARKRFIIETNGAGVAFWTTTTTAGWTRSC